MGRRGRVATKNLVFVISRNFREIFNFVFREIFLEFCKIKIYFRFAKLKENFAKHEIKNFVKISRNYKNEVLQQSYAGLTLDGWFFLFTLYRMEEHFSRIAQDVLYVIHFAKKDMFIKSRLQ